MTLEEVVKERCPTPRKLLYAFEAHARPHAEQVTRNTGRPCEVYRCPCAFWHIRTEKR